MGGRAVDKPENPLAFPRPAASGWPAEDGMTLRDWFAGQCDVAVYTPIQSLELAHGRRPTIGELAEYVAEIRHLEADAMLAARATEA